VSFLAQEVIRRKRDGSALSAEQIEWLVAGITDGSISDAQVGALAMAIVINGMGGAERAGGALRVAERLLVAEWLARQALGEVRDRRDRRDA